MKKTCNILRLISNYYDVLIQPLSFELSKYYVIDPSNLTKCLNTSVMIVYLLFRMKGVRKMKHCDTVDTRRRIEHGTELFECSFKQFKKELLSHRSLNESVLFYVMLTDSTRFTNTNSHDGKKPPYFPGHTFLIEKRPNNKFVIYQSYINEFDLKEYLNNNECDTWSESEISIVVNSIERICKDNSVDNEWDSEMNNTWKFITGVNEKQFVGNNIQGIHFCYKRFTTKQALKNVFMSIKQLQKYSYINQSVNINTRNKLNYLKSRLEYFMNLH